MIPVAAAQSTPAGSSSTTSGSGQTSSAPQAGQSKPDAAAQPGGATARPAPAQAGQGNASADQYAIDFDPKTGMPTYKEIQEDWSSLKIGISKLEPSAPLVAETAEFDGFTRSLVQVKWRPGDPIDLYVILPKGVKNPPAVLYLYNFLEDLDRFRDDRWCQRTTSGGVAAIGFVSALSGPRFHGRPLEQWFVSELQESLGSSVHDVHFILDYLASRGDIDMNRIGMFGQASGGTIALLAAAADPRIKAVDALDPWGDWPVWMAKSPVVLDDPHHTDFASQKDFLSKVAPLDPVKWLPTLTSTKVRIQQVMASKVTPEEAKDAIEKAAPKQAEVVRYKDGQELAKAMSGGVLFQWLKETLMTVPQQQPQSAAMASEAHPQADAHPSASPAKQH